MITNSNNINQRLQRKGTYHHENSLPVSMIPESGIINGQQNTRDKRQIKWINRLKKMPCIYSF